MGEVGIRSRPARVVLMLALVVPLLAALPAAAAPLANRHFDRAWARTDRPVADQTVRRTWMWGPAAFSGAMLETYLEGPSGSRAVQYFDKSRMEITDPAGDPSSSWFVTNGLLVVELVSGRLQLGDDVFVQLAPAAVNVAGDPDDPLGPTYATIAALLDAAPATPGAQYVQRLGRDGSVTVDAALAARDVRAAFVDDVTHHAIAAPFWAFMTSSGAVSDGGAIVHDQLFENPFYATGRPISEAYWATVRVGGTPRDVLMQCFERRCLTWTPDNPDGWQVEAGNVGRHYFAWRYESGHGFTSAWIDGARGGEVSYQGAVSVAIPAGALSRPSVVAIVPTPTAGPLAGFVPVGIGWRIEASGGDVVGELTLSFAVDPASLPAGADASRSQVAYFDESTARWVTVPTTVSVDAGRASVTTTHLSLWQVFVPAVSGGSPPPPDPPTPPPPPPSAPNVAPQADLNGAALTGIDHAVSARAGAGPIAIAPLAEVIDPDDATLASITIELLDAPDGSRERLAATAIPSVVVQYDQSGHWLQLSGPSPRLSLQQALRLVTYQHTGDDRATAGDRRIAVRVTDRGGAGPISWVTVGVSPGEPNRPPVVADSAVTTDEDVAVSITLSATDPEGGRVAFTITRDPQHGRLSGVAPALVYTPAADFHGSDSFEWSATDARGASSAASVSITINPVNDVPVAHTAAIVTDEGVPVSIVLAGFDADGDALTYAVVTPPGHGTLTGATPSLQYVPATDFAGEDSFEFTVSDGVDTSAPARVTITVRAVDDPPMAIAQQITTDEDTAVDIVLEGIDDGEGLVFSITAPPAHGTLAGTVPNLTYTPAGDFHGNDAFSFTVDDGAHVSEPAVVSIIVTPVNDPPTASDQAITILEDGQLFFTVTGSDVDGDAVRFTVTRLPTRGALSIDGDWTCVRDSMPRVCSHVVHYAPGANVNGGDSFEFTVSDGTVSSAPATVSITITPVNDPPTALDDAAEADEDSVDIVIDVLANDSADPDDGEVLEILGVDAFSSGGSAVVAGGVVRYTPAPDFYGTETFRYTISDGNGGEASATVTVDVAGVNDDPTAIDDEFEIDEDSGPTPLDLLANDTIAPDRDETLTINDYTAPSHGSLAVDPVSGHLRYRPADDFFGPDTFDYTISDGNGGSATATVSITVRSVNDPPTAVDDAFAFDEDAAPTTLDVLANDTFAPDVDETLRITAVDAATLGVVEIIESGAALRYTPAADAFGADTFTYTITDDGGLTATATVRVTISAVNDAPVLAASPAALSYREDDPPLDLVPALTLTDVDSDIATATIVFETRPDGAAETLSVVVEGAAPTTAVNAETGAVTLTGLAPAAAYQQALRGLSYVNSSQAPTAGDRVVAITVSDGDLSATLRLTITVVPVNDPPVLVFGGVVSPDSGPVTLDAGATLTDVDSPDFDGGKLSATITAGYDDGDALSVVAAGRLGLSGVTLSWDGGSGPVTIGVLESGARLLVVTFNANATPERVQAVVRALAFITTSRSSSDRLVAVVVSDGDGGGSETGIVTVGVNQPPDGITLSAASIPEDAVAGDVVGVITGHDPNGDSLSFALVADSDARFEVTYDAGIWRLSVASGATFDFETESEIDVAIRASDPSGRTYDEAFTITVLDVNEPPVIVGPTSFEIAENSPVGTVVGVVGSDEPDRDQTHSFSITAGNDAGAFTIDAATGQITVADPEPLDYETTSSFQITITVTDDGEPPLSASAVVTISLTDVSEDVDDTEPPTVEYLEYSNLIGNLRLRAGAADGLLSTSSDPEGSALTLVDASAYGGPEFGALAWEPDGSFTWDPPVGEKSTAGTWQITVADAAGHQSTGFVTFSLANRRVLFVDNTPSAATPDGGPGAPFTTLAQAVSASANNDIIYLASGDAPYLGGVALRSGVALVGAGATGASLGAALGIAPLARGSQEFPAIGGAKPTITNANGPGVSLSSGNIIAGLTLGATRGVALSGDGGGTQAGPVVRDVAITGTGERVGAALQLTGYVGGSLTFDAIQRELTYDAGPQAVIHLAQMPTTSVVVVGPTNLASSLRGGLWLRSIGSVELRGAVAVSTSGAIGIDAQSTTLRLSGDASKAISASGNKPAVYLRNGATFAVANGGLEISSFGANGLDVYGATIELTGAGSAIETTNGVALALRQSTIGPAGVALDAVSASGGESGIIVDTVVGGPLTIGPDDPDAAFGDGGTISGTTGPAVVLDYASDLTLRHLVVGAGEAIVGETEPTAKAIAGVGIDVAYVAGLTLDHVKIARVGSHAIAGIEVAGFALTRSEIIAAGQNSLMFDGPAVGGENGLTATAVIADTVVDGYLGVGLVVRNAPTADTALDLTVARSTFARDLDAGGGVRLRAEGLATMDVLVEDCAFGGLAGSPVDGEQSGSGALNLTVR